MQIIHRCGATGFTHHPCIEHLIYGVHTRSALRCRDVLALIHADAGRPRDAPAADAVDTAHDAGVPRAAQPHALQAAPTTPSAAADTAQPAVATSALGHGTFPDVIRAPFHLLRSHAVRRGLSTNPRGVRHSRLVDWSALHIDEPLSDLDTDWRLRVKGISRSGHPIPTPGTRGSFCTAVVPATRQRRPGSAVPVPGPAATADGPTVYIGYDFVAVNGVRLQQYTQQATWLYWTDQTGSHDMGAPIHGVMYFRDDLCTFDATVAYQQRRPRRSGGADPRQGAQQVDGLRWAHWRGHRSRLIGKLEWMSLFDPRRNRPAPDAQLRVMPFSCANRAQFQRPAVLRTTLGRKPRTFGSAGEIFPARMLAKLAASQHAYQQMEAQLARYVPAPDQPAGIIPLEWIRSNVAVPPIVYIRNDQLQPAAQGMHIDMLPLRRGERAEEVPWDAPARAHTLNHTYVRHMTIRMGWADLNLAPMLETGVHRADCAPGTPPPSLDILIMPPTLPYLSLYTECMRQLKAETSKGWWSGLATTATSVPMLVPSKGAVPKTNGDSRISTNHTSPHEGHERAFRALHKVQADQCAARAPLCDTVCPPHDSLPQSYNARLDMKNWPATRPEYGKLNMVRATDVGQDIAILLQFFSHIVVVVLDASGYFKQFHVTRTRAMIQGAATGDGYAIDMVGEFGAGDFPKFTGDLSSFCAETVMHIGHESCHRAQLYRTDPEMRAFAARALQLGPRHGRAVYARKFSDDLVAAAPLQAAAHLRHAVCEMSTQTRVDYGIPGVLVGHTADTRREGDDAAATEKIQGWQPLIDGIATTSFDFIGYTFDILRRRITLTEKKQTKYPPELRRLAAMPPEECTINTAQRASGLKLHIATVSPAGKRDQSALRACEWAAKVRYQKQTGRAHADRVHHKGVPDDTPCNFSPEARAEITRAIEQTTAWVPMHPDWARADIHAPSTLPTFSDASNDDGWGFWFVIWGATLTEHRVFYQCGCWTDKQLPYSIGAKELIAKIYALSAARPFVHSHMQHVVQILDSLAVRDAMWGMRSGEPLMGQLREHALAMADTISIMVLEEHRYREWNRGADTLTHQSRVQFERAVRALGFVHVLDLGHLDVSVNVDAHV